MKWNKDAVRFFAAIMGTLSFMVFYGIVGLWQNQYASFVAPMSFDVGVLLCCAWGSCMGWIVIAVIGGATD